MIDRHVQGIVPPKPHSQARRPDGALYYEELHTRDGFDGAFTYFYHREPAPPSSAVKASDRGFVAPRRDRDACEPLQRRLYDSTRVPRATMLCYERTPIFFTDLATIWLARPSATDELYFANSDGDELWFVQQGTARLESNCGWLEVNAGDYVFVPRAMPHRWHLAAPELWLLGIEGRAGLKVPDAYRNGIGQLRMDAPYTHRDFVRPVGPIARPDRPL
ncbi:MAG TPA: homogentisate 1,2-dioxygenase, partial [Polyangiaceae bacterium]